MVIKNTYFTSYFPLISIVFFSMSFAINVQNHVVGFLQDFGVYAGMLEFFTAGGIKLTIFFLLALVFFMVIAALKIIADTVIQLSLLFFTNDDKGQIVNEIRAGSWIYLLSSVVAMLTVKWLMVVVILFILASIIYFIYFIYHVSDKLSFIRQIGLVCFHLFFWSSFIFTVCFAALKLYNSFIQSLPFV